MGCGLTAGVVEEFYYPGLIVALFTVYGIIAPAIVLTASGIFALIHREDGAANILSAFSVDVALTSYYVRFRMIWPLIIAHFIFDRVWYFKNL